MAIKIEIEIKNTVKNDKRIKMWNGKSNKHIFTVQIEIGCSLQFQIEKTYWKYKCDY